MGNTRKIIAIAEGAYPVGGAPTNRHLSYLKGLIEIGVAVDLLITYPAKKQPVQSSDSQGAFNGIRFKYTLGSTRYEKNKYKRQIDRIKGLVNTLKEVKRKLQKNDKRETAIIILTTGFFDVLPFLILAKYYNIKIFHERTEHPNVNITHSFVSRMLTRIYLNYAIPRFSGLYVISYYLKDFFSKYTKKKIEIINMTVEPERFNIERNSVANYIAYTGSMYTNKDGVPDLLEAFDIIAEKHNNYKLMLIGDNSDENKFKYISDKINSLKWKDNVICKGLVPRDEIPFLIVNATVLALARPDNLQAKAGFPTKLGEYLATGNPVVITSVGEIPKYLTHEVNAFMAKPDDCKDFAEKVIGVIENYDYAMRIGQKGKELCETEFNYKQQANKLYRFLYEVS